MKELNLKTNLFFLLFVFNINASAIDIVVENEDGIKIFYNYYNNGKELEVTYGYYGITAHNYDYKVIRIPEEVVYMNRKRKVTRIGNQAFSYQTVGKLVLPNTIKSIGDRAFNTSYELKELNIPDSVETIGDYAFYHCKLNKLYIGKGLKTVGYFAKEGVSINVDSIFIKDFASYLNIDFKGPNNFIGGGKGFLFNDKNELMSNIIIPDGVTRVKRNLMNSKSITSINIPESMTEIDSCAFLGCSNLSNVTIHDNVTNINYAAFWGCNIRNIELPKNLKYIKSYAFYSCKLTKITIPDKVISIGKSAFLDNALSSVIIPQSVKELGAGAFSCDSLLTVISKLTNPQEVPAGEWADGSRKEFYYSYNLNTLMNATLYVPAGTKEKYMEADGWKDFVFIEEMNTTGVLTREESSKTFETKRYTLNGHQITKPCKGINIIRTSEGKTKKVFVK